MTSCERTEKLDACFDRQLPPAEAHEWAQHVQSCPACSLEIAKMQKLSDLLATATSARLSDDARVRLHETLDEPHEEPNRLLLSGAKVLTAAAAVVLLVTGIRLATVRSAPSGSDDGTPGVTAVVHDPAKTPDRSLVNFSNGLPEKPQLSTRP